MNGGLVIFGDGNIAIMKGKENAEIHGLTIFYKF